MSQYVLIAPRKPCISLILCGGSRSRMTEIFFLLVIGFMDRTVTLEGVNGEFKAR